MKNPSVQLRYPWGFVTKAFTTVLEFIAPYPFSGRRMSPSIASPELATCARMCCNYIDFQSVLQLDTNSYRQARSALSRAPAHGPVKDVFERYFLPR